MGVAGLLKCPSSRAPGFASVQNTGPVARVLGVPCTHEKMGFPGSLCSLARPYSHTEAVCFEPETPHPCSNSRENNSLFRGSLDF